MIQSKESLEIPVYLDHQSTTPCDPRVVEELASVLTRDFGNPHSVEHVYGRRAGSILSKARERIAESLSAYPSEVVFCSGATEANNLAIRGYARERNKRQMSMIVAANDHKSILNAAQDSTLDADALVIISVDRDGIVNLGEIAAAAAKGPIYCSISWVNSELGVIQPINEIARLVRQSGGVFHLDGSQALGRLPVNFDELDIDAISISSHKCYGPKGIGALLLRKDFRRNLEPIIVGGGQEDGLRSGTAPTFLAAGFARACELATNEWREDEQRISALRANLVEAMNAADPRCGHNGAGAVRIGGALNVSFSAADADMLINRLYKRVAISKSSACNVGSVNGSHVLAAIGLDDAEIRRTIRLCIGRFNTREEIDAAVEGFGQALAS